MKPNHPPWLIIEVAIEPVSKADQEKLGIALLELEAPTPDMPPEGQWPSPAAAAALRA